MKILCLSHNTAFIFWQMTCYASDRQLFYYYFSKYILELLHLKHTKSFLNGWGRFMALAWNVGIRAESLMSINDVMAKVKHDIL